MCINTASEISPAILIKLKEKQEGFCALSCSCTKLVLSYLIFGIVYLVLGRVYLKFGHYIPGSNLFKAVYSAYSCWNFYAGWKNIWMSSWWRRWQTSTVRAAIWANFEMFERWWRPRNIATSKLSNWTLENYTRPTPKALWTAENLRGHNS